MKNLIIILAILSLTACGSSGFASSDSEIVEISLRDETVDPSLGTQLRVEFIVGADYDGTDTDGDNNYTSIPFEIVILLPGGTAYSPNTSKLSDSLFGDVLFGNPDPREPNKTGTCPNGTSYLYYAFNEGAFGDPVNNFDSSSIFLKLDLLVDASAAGMQITAAVPQGPGTVDPCETLPGLSTAININ